MPSLTEWAQIIFADKTGNLGGDKSKALAELRSRAADTGQTLASYIEPALTVGTGMAGQAVGGIVGAAGLPFGVDAASNAVKRTQDWMTYVPRTEGGQKGMQVLGDAMSSLEDRINTATAIGSGLATYQATGDIEQAANVGKTVKDKGIGTAAGDYVADTTGSPLLATAVSMVPEAIDAVAGTKLAGKIPGQQFEMGDIGGQKFGQRGAVGGVDDGKKGFASSEVTRDIDIDDFGDEIEGEPYVLINKVEVPEEHRGQGVGRKLMEKEIAEQSRANPDLPFELAAIPLDDATDVNKLVGFYESMGFREPVSDYDLDFTHTKMTAPQAKKIADKYYKD